MRRLLPALLIVVALSGCTATVHPEADPPSTTPATATQSETPTPTPTPAKPIGYAELSNAPVPALCGFAAGALQGGKYAGDLAASAPPEANAQYAQYYLEDDQQGVHWAVDAAAPDAVVPASGIVAASVVYCDLGGVAWPENVVAYDRELNVVASANLVDILEESNSTIRSLSVADGKVTVAWDTQGASDPSAVQSIRATATLIANGPALVADGEVTQEPAPAG